MAIVQLEAMLTSRTNAEAFWCPRCRVEPGQPCVGARDKLREASHAERHERACSRYRRFGSWPRAKTAEPSPAVVAAAVRERAFTP